MSCGEGATLDATKCGSIAERVASRTVSRLIEETTRVKTIVLDVPGWARHVAGKNVDVRLTAEDGGPITWRVDDGGPLLVVADGSGLVPLIAMLRHRTVRSSAVGARLLISTGSPAEVPYRS